MASSIGATMPSVRSTALPRTTAMNFSGISSSNRVVVHFPPTANPPPIAPRASTSRNTSES